MRINVLLMSVVIGATAWVPFASHATQAAVKADNKADFDDVVAAVKKQMVPGGRYEFVDSAERTTINTNLAQMQALFDKFDTVSAMDKDAKFNLYVDQENVNAILTHRDGQRMVCVSERPIGSLIPKRVCRTYAAVEHDRQNTHDEMLRFARPGYIKSEGGESGATMKATLGQGQH